MYKVKIYTSHHLYKFQFFIDDNFNFHRMNGPAIESYNGNKY